MRRNSLVAKSSTKRRKLVGTGASNLRSPDHSFSANLARILFALCSSLVILLSQAQISAAANDQHPPANGNNNGKNQPVIPPSNFIQTEKKASISGIRIEPEEPGGPGFVGYLDKGISIVTPDTQVRVVIFGFWLDEIVMVGFTPDENCTNTILNIKHEDFWIQTERRMVILYEFPQSTSLFKLCMKQKKLDGNGMDLPYTLVDEMRATVTTDTPPRQYYFPMGVQISIVAVLLVLSGLFSGLNLGLMSLTPQELMLISNSGSNKERRYAQTILPIRKSGNLLLCSLLIGNVMVNSAISILFDDLTSGYVALIISSAGIVIFGEIFPQALCVKKGLAVGARTIWVTRLFMGLTFPLAYPISRILDCVLGEEVVSYDRKRLMELIKMTTKTAGTAEGELKIAIGAMELADKTVSDVMTKIDDVFMLPEETILNTKVVAEIVRSGYTRIPVYSGNRNNVIALLFVKDLALLDPDDNFSVRTVCGYHEHALRMVNEDTPLRAMLEEFKKGDYHLAMVRRALDNTHFEMVGIVTLEDIIEEILQAEIVDETDVITDNVSRIRRRRAQAHDLALMTVDDQTQCAISMQMQLVTVQYLVSKHPAFYINRIAPSILEKVIRKHVHKVEVSHLASDISDGGANIVFPRSAKLYTKQEPSDKFILILEGRAMVTIGRNEMTFDAGPWQCFGIELLDKLKQMIDQKEGTSGIIAPQYTGGGGSVGGGSGQNPLLGKSGRTDSVVVVGSAAEKPPVPPSTLGTTRASQGALLQQAAPSQVLSIPTSELAAEGTKKITFIPDFSVVIRDECTYLEITAQTYLLAYKSTLLSKNKEQRDDGTRPSIHDSFRSLHNNGFIIGGSSTGSGSGSSNNTNKPSSPVKPTIASDSNTNNVSGTTSSSGSGVSGRGGASRQFSPKNQPSPPGGEGGNTTDEDTSSATLCPTTQYSSAAYISGGSSSNLARNAVRNQMEKTRQRQQDSHHQRSGSDCTAGAVIPLLLQASSQSVDIASEDFVDAETGTLLPSSSSKNGKET